MDEDDKPTKEDLIETYRDINVDHPGWWEFAYEDFTADMEKRGIEVSDMSFEGFYSQGDYATFEGSVPDKAFFMREEKLDSKYPNIYKAAELGALYSIRFSALSGHRWRGHQSSSIDIEDVHYYNIVDDEDMNLYYQDLYEEGVNEEYRAFEAEVKSIAKDYAEKLFDTLRGNYAWLTSDEQVWDTIVANEMHL